MALSPGDQIGPYRVTARIGQGGMGEVYLATDTKLQRDVALKVLPASFTHDAARIARFTREAQVLASLNHPNIGGIYGLEDAHGVTALVLELIEGPTLADRLAGRRALPVAEAIAIARQIAEALEAAHDRSVIHRDLKPSNIKVRPDGTVKVLDFGLAKALDRSGESGWPGGAVGPSDSPEQPDVSAPTLTSPSLVTGAGVILGTASYMSPEQAAGQLTDRRSDLWSFGIVLMEMLTGQRVFQGETMTHVLAAVLRSEPDWPALPADTPEPVRRLLRRCLEKDRRRRLDSAAAALLELDEARTSTSSVPSALAAPPPAPSPVRGSFSFAPVALAAVVGAAATSVAWWALNRPVAVPPPPIVRFAVVPPAAQPFGPSQQASSRDFAVAPNGAFLVYRSGDGQLVLRAFDHLDATPLQGVASAYMPTVSPDSKWIGYVDDGPTLKKVAVAGGAPVTLARLPIWPRGVAWVDDATIVVGSNSPTTGLMRVPAGGGDPVMLTTPDGSKGEEGHLLPAALPGTHAVLFTIGATDPRNAQVALYDLETRTRTTLLRGGRDARYVPSGHLVYLGDRVMSAVRFDLSRRAIVGEPVRVVDGIAATPTSALNAAVTDAGTLVYVPAGTSGVPRRLLWVDRQGRETPIAMPPRPYESFRLSPDGTRIAVSSRDEDSDVWVWDLVRQTLTRETFDADIDLCPIWSPDGRRLVFASTRTGIFNLYALDLNDGHGDVRLTSSANTQLPNSITPDGSAVIAHEVRPATKSDLLRVSLATTGTPAGRATEELANGPFDEWNGELSPDGRLLAYQSTESGAIEVYVRPYPVAGGARWQVSSGGGSEPAWTRNGRELVYLDGARHLTVVPVTASGATFAAGAPLTISATAYQSAGVWRSYDVTPDGQRFLVMRPVTDGTRAVPVPGFVVVQNWMEELRRLVPGK